MSDRSRPSGLLVATLVGLAALLVCTACSTFPTAPGAAATARNATSAENARPGTPGWRIPEDRKPSASQLAAFAGRDSVLPGEPLDLYVDSRLGDFTVTAYRLGFYAGTGARQVWRSASTRGEAQPRAELAPGNMVTTPAGSST